MLRRITRAVVLSLLIGIGASLVVRALIPGVKQETKAQG